MRKLLSIILLIVMLLCVFTSCNNNEPITEVDADGFVVVNGFKTEYRVVQEGSNEIHYPLLKTDTKIDALQFDLQQKIDDYVADCKTIYTASYVNTLAGAFEEFEELYGEPYISFTDTFVYDFSEVDESGLGVTTSKIWNDIKAFSDGNSVPIMYIELQGFSNYWGESYKATTLLENGIIYGYFIFEDETVIPYNYRNICNKYYHYKMPEGTELINCGDKHSEEKKMEELADLYYAIGEGLFTNDSLKRLKLLQKQAQ